MTTVTTTRLTQALRRAAVRATLAPSVHNTQPWRFRLAPDALEIYLDGSRRLQVLDPFGRQQMISCGCALFNARVSLAASGVDVEVERFPDPLRPDLLARVRIVGGAGGTRTARPDRADSNANGTGGLVGQTGSRQWCRSARCLIVDTVLVRAAAD